jgi:hypothetical protein
LSILYKYIHLCCLTSTNNWRNYRRCHPHRTSRYWFRLLTNSWLINRACWKWLYRFPAYYRIPPLRRWATCNQCDSGRNNNLR